MQLFQLKWRKHKIKSTWVSKKRSTDLYASGVVWTVDNVIAGTLAIAQVFGHLEHQLRIVHFRVHAVAGGATRLVRLHRLRSGRHKTSFNWAVIVTYSILFIPSFDRRFSTCFIHIHVRHVFFFSCFRVVFRISTGGM